MKKAFNIIAKPIGPICNMDCKYCFYLKKETLYPEEKNWIMPDNILENFTRQYIQGQEIDTIQFVWQGGEPTLAGLNFFKRALEFQSRFSNGKKVENVFQTNGILLDDEWCEFFAANNFLVGISMDGPQFLHDYYRKSKNRNSTFDAVLRGIEFLKKYDVEFNTLTVVNRINSYHSVEVYRFLKEIESQFMQFIPAVEQKKLDGNHGYRLPSASKESSENSTDWSVEPIQYGNFLCEIFDEWVRNDVGNYYIQTFDVALENWCNILASLCVFAQTCGTALAVEHNGDLYSCDHYVYPQNNLGNIRITNIDSLVFSEKQIEFGLNKKAQLPEYCKRCEFLFACNGGCPKNRFTNSPDGEFGLNYLCQGYKLFFNHIAPYMNFMLSELKYQRPPANVMEWTESWK